MIDNAIIKQTEQPSREFNKKNDIFCKFMDRNIFMILQIASYKMMLLLTRQGYHQMFQKILIVAL